MMLPPENTPLKKIGETLGIPEGTLKKWKQELRVNGHTLTESDPWNVNTLYPYIMRCSTHPTIT